MADKITRRELKRNELAETMGRTVDYVSHHRRGVTEALAIGAGLLLLIGGFFLVQAFRERQAGRELSAGLASLQVPLATDPSAATAPVTYPTSVLRDRAAEERFRKAASYRGTRSGRAAAVILAARGEGAGKALEVFSRAARDDGAEIAAAAEINAARLLASQGKTTEAIERLRRSIDSPDSKAPKDALLFALAQIYERAGVRADARATYQRIVADFPASPYRGEARQLAGTTPQLNSTAPQLDGTTP